MVVKSFYSVPKDFIDQSDRAWREGYGSTLTGTKSSYGGILNSF